MRAPRDTGKAGGDTIESSRRTGTMADRKEGRGGWTRREVGLGIAGTALGFGLANIIRPRIAHAASFGQIIVLEGKAVVTRGGKPQIVRDKAPLEEGDRVDTLADTRAQLVIGDKDAGLEAMLSSRTSITVNQVVQNASATSPILLAFGALRSRVRSWAGQPFVATRAATIGIKGTDFVTWVKRPEASEFVGIEGLIECVSKSNANYSIRIGQRQWGEIVENEQPKAPIHVPDSIWDAVQKEFAFPTK
jgi:hypothetical protein